MPSETFVMPRCAAGDMPVAYHPAQDNCDALSCAATLQAVRRSKSLASVRHNDERERVSEGTVADCPFLMSEQRPQNIKLYSRYARSNNQAQR